MRGNEVFDDNPHHFWVSTDCQSKLDNKVYGSEVSILS